MSCYSDLDCPGAQLCDFYGYCVDSLIISSDDMDTALIALGILYGIVILMAIFAVVYFPLRDADNNNMKCVTAASVIFIPWLYFLVLAYQNPLKTSGGRPNYVPTIVLALIFPIALFCVVPHDGWKAQSSAKISDFY